MNDDTSWWKKHSKKIVLTLLDSIGLIIAVVIVWLLFLVAETTSPRIVSNILADIKWPIVLVLFGIIFLVPIYRILSNLSSKLAGASKVKFGDVEIHTDEVKEIIVEREKLRAGIYIASVDNDPSPKELEYLHRIQSEFQDRLSEVPEIGRISVLQSTIRVALADGDFYPSEYNALVNLASKFGVMVDKLETQIVNEIIENGIVGKKVKIISMPELKNKLTQAKSQRGIL